MKLEVPYIYKIRMLPPRKRIVRDLLVMGRVEWDFPVVNSKDAPVLGRFNSSANDCKNILAPDHSIEYRELNGMLVKPILVPPVEDLIPPQNVQIFRQPYTSLGVDQAKEWFVRWEKELGDHWGRKKPGQRETSVSPISAQTKWLERSIIKDTEATKGAEIYGSNKDTMLEKVIAQLRNCAIIDNLLYAPSMGPYFCVERDYHHDYRDGIRAVGRTTISIVLREYPELQGNGKVLSNNNNIFSPDDEQSAQERLEEVANERRANRQNFDIETFRNLEVISPKLYNYSGYVKKFHLLNCVERFRDIFGPSLYTRPAEVIVEFSEMIQQYDKLKSSSGLLDTNAMQSMLNKMKNLSYQFRALGDQRASLDNQQNPLSFYIKQFEKGQQAPVVEDQEQAEDTINFDDLEGWNP